MSSSMRVAQATRYNWGEGVKVRVVRGQNVHNYSCTGARCTVSRLIVFRVYKRKDVLCGSVQFFATSSTWSRCTMIEMTGSSSTNDQFEWVNAEAGFQPCVRKAPGGA